MRTSIKITDHVIKKGGFFSSDYVLYTVQTAPTRWKVERKDNDFYTLRRLIRKEFPHLLVPPLPIKNTKMTLKVLQKRERQFSRFLQALGRAEEIKASKFFIAFL